ncbi:hypothetical protein GH714_021088 [Hevea brasiliensis]|uniref:Uncharacterized protein n=1 Tax=Hevea brasiliensis TaxID=3981 RepID=A0A6A6N3S4_HEVBR|nr:hypothetical protein GH714_021088 [Hevea brasiliensis]
MVHDESLQQKEPKTPHQESQYNKQELDSALLVIKKEMKMAAEPFNVPVNPEALGIPVIKKEMKLDAAEPFNVPVNPEALGIPEFD